MLKNVSKLCMICDLPFVFFFKTMERWNDRVALVTGASCGIGAAICRELVKYGVKVVGCARNVQQIRDLAEEEDVKKQPGSIFAVK